MPFYKAVYNDKLLFVSFRFASISHCGTKHDTNEDRTLCNEKLRLFAVADGMSGASGGAVASELAVRVLEEYFEMAVQEEKLNSSLCETMKEAFFAANHFIFQTSIAKPELIGMGTTLTAAVVTQGRIVVGHVGDTRLFVLDPCSSRLVTADHCIGRKRHQLQTRMLSRAVGLNESVDVDIYEESIGEESFCLICSDGISDYVNAQDFEGDWLQFLQQKGPSLAIEELVQLARDRGSDDDASAVGFFYKTLFESTA